MLQAKLLMDDTQTKGVNGSLATTPHANVRMLGGVFVWAIEGCVFALLSWASFVSFKALGVLPGHSLHEWATLAVFFSSVVHLCAHTVVAFSKRKDELVNGDPNAELHHGLVTYTSCASC